MALPTSGAVTAAQWNAEFQALLNEMLTGAFRVSTDEPEFPVPWFFTGITSATDESRRSLIFTAPMDMWLMAASIGTVGLASLVTATLSPVDVPDLLAQGVTADYPSVSALAGGTGKTVNDEDFSPSTGPAQALKRGEKYKIVVTSSAVGALPFCSGSFTFSSYGKRV